MWVSKLTPKSSLSFDISSFNPSYSGCGLVSTSSTLLPTFIFVGFNPSYSGCGLVSPRPKGSYLKYFFVSILLILDVG